MYKKAAVLAAFLIHLKVSKNKIIKRLIFPYLKRELKNGIIILIGRMTLNLSRKFQQTHIIVLLIMVHLKGLFP